MKYTVPNITDWSDDSYTVSLTAGQQADAIRAAESKLGASRIGRSWYYRANETDEVYRLTRAELISYGSGLLDERGVDYSLWCSQTGHLISHPSRIVREAVGSWD